ncbi:MAG TPA: hypothetical protein VNJ07_02245 [Chitinophagales bacterium]|nr:hypothetical protein [Chitinophagales bacterium]
MTDHDGPDRKAKQLRSIAPLRTVATKFKISQSYFYESAIATYDSPTLIFSI